jgi:hypothetical protein
MTVQSSLIGYCNSNSLYDRIFVSSESGLQVITLSQSFIDRMYDSKRFDTLVRLHALGLFPQLTPEMESEIQAHFDSLPELVLTTPADMPTPDSGLLDFLLNTWILADYEHGQVYGLAQDIISFDRSAQRKLGKFRNFRFLDPYNTRDLEIIVKAWESDFVLYSYKASSPRRRNFEHRQRIKSKLPRKHRGLFRLARRLTRSQEFIDRLTDEQREILTQCFGSPDLFHKLALGSEDYMHRQTLLLQE